MKTPVKTGAQGGSPGTSDRQTARAERLAAELRANLKRRKAAARERDGRTALDLPKPAQDSGPNPADAAPKGDADQSDASA